VEYPSVTDGPDGFHSYLLGVRRIGLLEARALGVRARRVGSAPSSGVQYDSTITAGSLVAWRGASGHREQ